MSETEAVTAPSQAPSQDAYGLANETGLGQPADETFPKVLRRRLDKFFAEQHISPKADGAMWTKIAVGLAVLGAAGSPSTRSGRIRGSLSLLYVLGGLAQTFLLAEHRPRQQPQRHLVLCRSSTRP
jgi:linoleoyl-CoA desaturase